MATPFKSMGDMLTTSVASFSEDVSTALITNLTPILIVAITIYFTLKGYLYMTGRAEGAIPDTVISAFKMSMIAYFAMNTGNYISYGISAINGAQELLVGALPGSHSTAWETIDSLWEKMGTGIDVLMDMFKLLGWSDVGPALLLVFCLFLYLGIAAYLTFAALGILIVAQLSLTVILGFGPLFLSLLMFPITRSWFDGWIKACLTYVFTMVIIAAIITLAIQVFEKQLAHIVAVTQNTQSLQGGQFAIFLSSLFTFLIVCVAITTLVKAVPSIASGVVGSVAMQAVGLGAMLNGANKRASNLVSGGAKLGAGLASGLGAKNVASKLGDMSKKVGAASGQTSAAMGMSGSALSALGAGTKRASRAIGAAMNRGANRDHK